MHLSQKTVLSSGNRVACLYWGMGNTKFSHEKGKSFKRSGSEKILYSGHYSVQRDYKSSWELKSQAPSQPSLLNIGAGFPESPNSNIFERENQKVSMGWNEKKDIITVLSRIL